MSVEQSRRYPLIDQIRGFAVLLMIIFHLSYDLSLFGYVDLVFTIESPFWYVFPRVIVFLFLSAMGLSLPLVHLPQIRWNIFWKRFGQISTFAAIISVGTYFLFPTRWIYFGTLHCIALCSLLGLPFLRFPRVSLFIGLALLIPALFWNLTIPWIVLDHFSMDYIPPFPWLGVVLLGFFASHRGWHQLILPGRPFIRWLEPMGKHSLIIYLIHQPLLFSTIKMIHYFSS
jgi:uncharacterized membrane protein